MIPIFRAWDKVNEEMLNVDIIDLFLEEIRVLKKEQKQKNFFKSLYEISQDSPDRILFGNQICKELTLNIPLDALEEIREWGEE